MDSHEAIYQNKEEENKKEEHKIAKTTAFMNDFYSKHPGCNPADSDFAGNFDKGCAVESANGAGCTITSMFAAGNNPSCKNSVNTQYRKKIETLRKCRSSLFTLYTNRVLADLKTDESLMIGALYSQEQMFDSALDLLDAQLDAEITIENFMSAAVFVLLLIIITYLLFSKIFV